MRNLDLVSKSIVKPPYHSPILICPADNSSVVAIDRLEDEQNVQRRIIRIFPGQSKVDELYVFSEQDLELLHPLDKAVQAEYVSLTESLFVATNSGGFYQIGVGSGLFEELFVAPSGISAFALSPDSRFLAVATKEETVTLFALPDLELITTVELGAQRPEDALDELYDVVIQWRHDSQYFGVNFYDGTTRKVHVYDETGKLYSKSEEGLVFSSKCLSWQPSGGLIAALGVSPSSSPNVVFFELNGLKRADFDPFEERTSDAERLPIVDLNWNVNSDVLALTKETSVELWVRANYAWMCKKTIFPENTNESNHAPPSTILSASWDAEISYRFHIITSSGAYGLYDLSFEFSKGNSDGSALVASINGPSIYCTPFRDCCAPPPTCRFQQIVSRCVQEIVVSNFWDGLFCVLTTGEIVVFKNSKTSLEKLASIESKSSEVNLQTCYNWIWPNHSQLACICNGNLLTFELDSTEFLSTEKESKDPANITMELKSNLSVRAKIIWPIFAKQNAVTQFLLIQKRCGAILLQELCVMPNILMGRLPNSVQSFQTFVNGENVSEHSLLVLGLDPFTKQLHSLHNKVPFKLLNDCNSIYSFQNYLLATVSQGSLEVIEFKDVVACHMNNTVTNDSMPKYSRKVEKGAVIVTCCWNRILEPSLTLQIIPRGNLETISPRPLMISSIDALLKNRKYNEVMIAMRRHRLDFDVLAAQLKSIVTAETKTKEEQLKSMLSALLQDVQDSHTVVLMVTELGESHGDCVKIMKDILHVMLFETKSEGLANKNDRLINPYLAVMAKLGLYEEVLRSPLIAVNDINRETVKSRIKFLGFYCENPEILYESALGTYDLTLTSLVADCLNKDPKEYLPILNEYQSLSCNKLKFAIDQKLKRYNKAVISLLELPETSTDEIVKYVERYKVHQVAIKFLATNTINIEDSKSVLDKIYCSYGEVFEDLRKFPEAAICYMRGNDLHKCFDCYAKSGNWNAAVSCVMSMNSNESVEMLQKLVRHLEDSKDYEGAGEVLEINLKNHAEACRAFVKARKWERAGRVAESSNLKAEYSNELQSFGATLLETCTTLEEEINKYKLRLQVVKTLKEQKAIDGVEHDNFSDTESISTTTSIRSGISSSMHSGKTTRSGKNSRKLKRKIYSLKEGSRFEDIALTAHLWEICQRVQAEIKPDVESTVPALWREGQDKIALVVINGFDKLLYCADVCVKEIWPSVLPPNEFLEMKYYIPPPGWSGTWNRCLILTDA